MLSYILFSYILLSVQVFGKNLDDGKCNRFEANFDMKNVVGFWNVVALVPGEGLSKNFSYSCMKVEFSDTDVAGLRWLVNSTVNSRIRPDTMKKISGSVIRQRYYSNEPFDVWSKAVEEVQGCFEQVVSMNHSASDLNKAMTQNERMQLHLVSTKNSKHGILIQLLWGKMINAVIYSKNKKISQDQLNNVFELLHKLGRKQLRPKYCEELLRDALTQS